MTTPRNRRPPADYIASNSFDVEQIAALRKILAYDPDTGIFTWRVTRGPNAPGYKAGYLSPKNYRYIGVFGKLRRASRLAWAIHYGVWPEQEIDHINGVRDDDRIVNLRQATRRQNNYNRAADPDGASGIKGVSFSTAKQKWVAQINYPPGVNKQRYLGQFDLVDDAAAAYQRAARELHGEFYAERNRDEK